MKCKHCNGTGKVQKWFYERTGFGKYEKVCGDVKCEWCNGTGEVEQTEQEYLQTCSTEQLVHVIHLMTTSCYVCGSDGVDYRRCYFRKQCTGPKEIEEWLKEPHPKWS